jgi:hypothetical protein
MITTVLKQDLWNQQELRYSTMVLVNSTEATFYRKTSSLNSKYTTLCWLGFAKFSPNCIESYPVWLALGAHPTTISSTAGGNNYVPAVTDMKRELSRRVHLLEYICIFPSASMYWHEYVSLLRFLPSCIGKPFILLTLTLVFWTFLGCH